MQETFYASAERADQNSIMESFKAISKNQIMANVMESLPYVASILNPDRQFVFVNKTLLNMLHCAQTEELLGKRPGEALNCIHSTVTESGCGTSPSCRYCGAVNTILESQKLQDKVEGECRITSKTDNGEDNFDFKVSAKPLTISDQTYTLFIVTDISDEKRRKALERIFFHDVLNKAGSMDGLIDMLQEIEEPDEAKGLLAVIQTVSNDLIGEIQFQRDIAAAETGDIELDIKPFDPWFFISEIVEQMRHHSSAKSKKIKTILASDTEEILSDQILLSRVLTNMIKNALEACSVGECVSALVYSKEDKIGFCIQNPKVMSEEIKSQVFQRSFSTKGANRGLGTYSIKLLGEKYLKGKVFFQSDEGDGTQFFIELPIIYA